jgi:hypothetical protein
MQPAVGGIASEQSADGGIFIGISVLLIFNLASRFGHRF